MTLIVCPLAQVPAVCAQRRPSHLLTLLSPGSEGPVLPKGRLPDRRLALDFHDIPEPQEGLTAPDRAMVEALLAFAADWSPGRPFLIHCWAGISRSTAAAFSIACQHRPEMDEHAMAAVLRRAAPFATPNPLVVSLADDILGRAGRMRAAVAAIGRGAEAPMGQAFDLDVMAVESP